MELSSLSHGAKPLRSLGIRDDNSPSTLPRAPYGQDRGRTRTKTNFFTTQCVEFELLPVRSASAPEVRSSVHGPALSDRSRGSLSRLDDAPPEARLGEYVTAHTAAERDDVFLPEPQGDGRVSRLGRRWSSR